LEDAERDLEYATETDRQKRIQKEIDELEQQIAPQQRVVDNPRESERSVQESITIGIELEREPEKPVSGTTRTKFINPPPLTAPTYFQDRHVETKLVGDFLKDEALRLMTVVGRGGIGKTAMVCRLLKSLESGRLPDDGGELSVDGIVYLSERGSRGVGVPYIYADLCKLLRDDVADELDKLYTNPQASIEAKMYSLLEAFPEGRYVLLLDNFEDMIDSVTREIRDAEHKGALRAFLEHPHHAIKVVLTTRFAPEPQELALFRPERQKTLNMEQGLPSKEAKEMLCEMDDDGTVGLRKAPEGLLDEVYDRTRGFPRALEALFAILSADRNTTLREVLDDTEGLLPENVVDVLVGEAFSRLDPVAQMVMQALAIYSYPVTSAAVDFLLLPHRTGGVDSAPVLGRLVNMQFVRKEAGRRYYLHQMDRTYALSRIPEGEVADRSEGEAPPPFTRFALLDRAADYLAQTRTPRETWKTIEDLRPQLQEFELRCEGQDYATAGNVLTGISFDYLHLWGHSQLAAELHERLQGKLDDPYSELENTMNLSIAYFDTGRYKEAIASNEEAVDGVREVGARAAEGSILGNLGNVYYVLGQYSRAIDYYEQALDIAREIGDRSSESTWLGNLSNIYGDLYQIPRSIDCSERALDIAREIGNRSEEASDLTRLGIAYFSLAQIEGAIDYYEQALDIAREIGNRNEEAIDLGNLGDAYSSLGQTERAIDYYEQALDIAREIGEPRIEVDILTNVGQLLARQEEWDKAKTQLEHAIHHADRLEYQQGQYKTRMKLACVYLYTGDVPSARRAIDSAQQHDAQNHDFELPALAGLIALRTGDLVAAQEAFQAAVAQGAEPLIESEGLYNALDAKGLALCGLALATGDKDFITPAMDAYRAARRVTKDSGILADVLRLFDALQEADSEGMLAEVREVASGTEANSTREA
jgi:tetratricopeptide (TPR) repeat protein